MSDKFQEEKNEVLKYILDTKFFSKLNEEINELKVALSHNSQAEIEDEFGDVLFSCVNVSRFIGVDASTYQEKGNVNDNDGWLSVEDRKNNRYLGRYHRLNCL